MGGGSIHSNHLEAPLAQLASTFLLDKERDQCSSFSIHQQNSTFATPSFDISHEQFSFYSQTQYVKSLFLIQRRFSEIFR